MPELLTVYTYVDTFTLDLVSQISQAISNCEIINAQKFGLFYIVPLYHELAAL